MPTEIIDLDELLGEPKQVRLGGELYTLPAQIPVPLYLRMKEQQKKRAEEDDSDIIESLYGEALALFQVNQPDLEELPLGIGQCLECIARIYNPAAFSQDTDEGDEDAPFEEETEEDKTPVRRGSASTKRKSQKSSSSAA